MELSENALRILEARYLLREGQGIVTETPGNMLKRVAAAVAGTEKYTAGTRLTGKTDFMT